MRSAHGQLTADIIKRLKTVKHTIPHKKVLRYASRSEFCAPYRFQGCKGSEDRDQGSGGDHQRLEKEGGENCAKQLAAGFLLDIVTQRDAEDIHEDHILHLTDEAGVAAEYEIESDKQEQGNILNEVVDDLHACSHSGFLKHIRLTAGDIVAHSHDYGGKRHPEQPCIQRNEAVHGCTENVPYEEAEANADSAADSKSFFASVYFEGQFRQLS